MSPDPIRPSDLEAKFRELQGSVEEQVEPVRQRGREVVIAGAAVVVLLVFLVGRRSGRRRSAIVEVRRF